MQAFRKPLQLCWAILATSAVLLAAAVLPADERPARAAAKSVKATEPTAAKADVAETAVEAEAATDESVTSEAAAGQKATDKAAKAADGKDTAAASADAKDTDAKPAAAKDAKSAEAKPARRGISGLRFEGDKPADDGGDAKAEAKPANPLGNLIRNIFRPAAPRPGRILPNPAPGEAAQAGEGPVNGDATARDRIDARAPHDPDQAKRLRRAAEFMAEARNGGSGENWKRAVEVLQFILDRPEDSVVRQANGQLASVRIEANRMLSELPPEHMQNYRNVYGGEATRLLREAAQSSDVSRLIEVATRFFHTEAGYEAANQLGSIHYDRGEFGMATYWFRQLIATKAPLTRDRKWQLKAAHAYHQAGDAGQSRELLAQASTGGPLDLGGGRVQPEEWLAGLDRLTSTHVPELGEWPLFMGTSQRLGKAVGGEPLLLPRWSHPLTYSRGVEEQVSYLVEDLTDQGRATVPVMNLLLVDGRIIARTLRGVQVIDAATGRVLWETDEGLSPEKLLSGEVKQEQYVNQWGGMMVAQGEVVYSGGGADQHALTSLLFRDGTWGMIASDGRQLFVLEDHAVLLGNPNEQQFGWWNPGVIVDPYRRDRTSNRLVSYDLQTGRPRWAVGGAMMDEPFDLRLAGYYFFGSPVLDGGELFIVGEKDSEIRLFSLDPDTGRPNWSQLVAYSDMKIDKDLGRRWFNAQVSVSGGVVICPTTVGWIVAVDRLNHSVLWAQRYSQVKNEPPQQPNGAVMVQVQALNQTWSPSAPVIIGDKILYTPPEEQVIECLSLYDGRRLWQEPKNNYLYLAGVSGDQAVFVGSDSVTALKLGDASKKWTLPIPPQDGRPSGYGVASGDVYYLPLSSGQLWSIDLADGEVQSKSYLREGEAPLGNLALYRGMLLSLTPGGLTAFEQREAFAERIRERKQQNPRDPWALLRESEIHLLAREYNDALTKLRGIDPAGLTDELRPQHRERLVEALAAVIRNDLKAHDAEMDELSSAATEPADRLLYERLEAERLRAREQHQQAFAQYLKLAERGGGSRMVSRGDDATIELQLDRWLAGELHSLWDEMPADARREAESRILALFAAAASDPDAASVRVAATDPASGEWDLQRLAVLFAFHPKATEAQQLLVEQAAVRGEFARAENGLLRLSRHTEPRVAAAALERLARLLVAHGLKADADEYYTRLGSLYPDVPLGGGDRTSRRSLDDGRNVRAPADGQTVQQHLAALRESGALPLSVEQRAEGWGEFDVQIDRRGTNYSSSSHQIHEVPTGSSALPFFEDRRLLYLQSEGRLAMVDAVDDALAWLVPLRRNASASHGNALPAEFSGHQLIVLHGDVIHCLSPVERRILWTRPLEIRGSSSGYYRHPHRDSVQQMQVGTSVTSGFSLSRQRTPQGMLAAANADYVCTYGRREFTVCDVLTGELLWKKTGIPQGTQVYGTEDFLFVVPRGNYSETVVLRALDGRQVPMPDAGGLLGRAIRISPRGFVVVEAGSSRSLLGLSGRQTLVRLVDPRDGTELWKVEFPNNTHFGLLDDLHLTALRPTGEVELVNLETGENRELGKIDPRDLRTKTSLYTIGDHDRVYLVINERQQGNRHYYSENMPSFEVNGKVVAFDRHAGRQLWEQQVLGKRLVYTELTHSPILVFTARTWDQNNMFGMWTTSLLALDKQTGRRLAEDESATNYSGFQWMTLNMSERFIELRSYNMLVRLKAVERSEESRAAAEGPVEATKPGQPATSG